uniref:Uncharacterized protein n=1 Tax=Dictyoglomus thermophilum TaxID=14 RepID=A0A7V3ZHG7_DICTH
MIDRLLNLMKYEFLGKRKTYLIFLLIYLGLVFIIWTRFHNRISDKDLELLTIYIFLTFFFSVGLVLIFIKNLRDINSEDLGYLSFSLPVTSYVLFLKRIKIVFSELVYFLLIVVLTGYFIFHGYNTSFSVAISSYFSKYGTILLIDFLFSFIFIFLIIALIIIARNLAYEKRFLRRLIYVGCTSYLVFGGYLHDFLAKCFPQKLLSIPSLEYQITSQGLQEGFNIPKTDYYVVGVLLKILLFILVIYLYNLLLEKYAERR